MIRFLLFFTVCYNIYVLNLESKDFSWTYTMHLDSGFSGAFNLIEKNKDGFVLVGRSVSQKNYQNLLTVCSLSKNGELNWKTNYNNNRHQISNPRSIQIDNFIEIYCNFYRYWYDLNLADVYFHLLRYSENGELFLNNIDTISQQTRMNIYGGEIIKSNNKYFNLMGYQNNYILKIFNDQGTLDEEKLIYSIPADTFKFIITRKLMNTFDGGYLSIHQLDIKSSNRINAYSILKHNSFMEKEWELIFKDSITFFINDIIQNDMGKFIILARYHSYYIDSVHFILTLNENGKIESLKKLHGGPYYSNFYFNKIIQTSDKGYILAGIKPKNEGYCFIILKTNKYLVPERELLLSCDDKNKGLSGLIETKDNKIVLCGSFDYQPFAAEVEEIIVSVKDIIKREKVITISPNPAGEYIEIALSSPRLKPWVGGVDAIKIFNLLGECVLSVAQTFPSVDSGQTGMSDLLRIDVSGLPAGVYFVRVGDWVGWFLKI